MSICVCVCVEWFVSEPWAAPSALRSHRPAVETRTAPGHVGQEVDRDIRMRAAVQNGITTCPEAALALTNTPYTAQKHGHFFFLIALDLWFINPQMVIHA